MCISISYLIVKVGSPQSEVHSGPFLLVRSDVLSFVCPSFLWQVQPVVLHLILPVKVVVPCEVGLFVFLFYIKRLFESGFVSAWFDIGLYLN